MFAGFLVGALPHVVQDPDCDALHGNGGLGVESLICFLNIDLVAYDLFIWEEPSYVVD